MRDVTKTGNGEREMEVWERVVSGNLHKNPIWPMVDDRETSYSVAILLELYAHEVLEIIRRKYLHDIFHLFAFY